MNLIASLVAGAALMYAALLLSARSNAWLVQQLRELLEEAKQAKSTSAMVAKQSEAIILLEQKVVEMNQSLMKLVMTSLASPGTMGAQGPRRALQVGEATNPSEAAMGFRSPMTREMEAREGFIGEDSEAKPALRRSEDSARAFATPT